ncbi:MAG: flagellar hook-basal body complex protein [Burkholderiaceae bacterium]
MSFEIARSGINAVNSSLDAISNNIANSGTYGYKSTRANFSAMYAGTQMNGAEVSSMSQSIETTGGLLNTGRSMDAMITGKGFFAVKNDAGQEVYTRVGIFNVDKDGNVIDSMGRNLQGYAAVLDTNGKPLTGAGLGALGNLTVPTGQVGAQASTKLAFNGNLSSDWTVPTTALFDKDDATSFNSSVTSTIYDSQGAQHSVTQYFIKTGPNTINVQYSFDGAVPTLPVQTLNFGPGGALLNTPATVPFAAAPAGVNPIALSIDYSGTTQYSGDTTTLTNSPDGNAAGTLTGVSLAADGGVIATYSNGDHLTMGTVALATFANENALQAISDTSWTANVDTGTPLYSQPGSATASKLSVGSIEQSNVDMTGELVNLMSAQRNYQANTKVISAESEMMQSLMQAV